MLSISTGKNQSTDASGALYIPTYEYNYKVIHSLLIILSSNSEVLPSFHTSVSCHSWTNSDKKRWEILNSFGSS